MIIFRVNDRVYFRIQFPRAGVIDEVKTCTDNITMIDHRNYRVRVSDIFPFWFDWHNLGLISRKAR